MSFSYINKISLYLSFIFIYSCQDTIISLDNKEDLNINNFNSQFETIEVFDNSFFELSENNGIDIYTIEPSRYNFLNENLNKLKVNNYEGKYNINTLINVIIHDDGIYSINSKGKLVKFDINTGKLIERYNIDLDILNKDPVSFSLYNNDFIIGFNSGNVARINKLGKIIWEFKNQNLLNSPIKIYGDNIIILYPEKIIFLDSTTGDVVYEKIFESDNIIQSSGGKIINYYNILFFILSNSQFKALDTFLFEEHNLNFDMIELNTSLNNLKDQIHIYKNFLVYLDNGNTVHTYDINNNEFILTDYRINNTSSTVLLNNALITKNDKFINIFNIKNGNLFAKVNINKVLGKKSTIINALIINKKIHLFTNTGRIIIFDKNFNIEKTVDLKIKNVNKVYSYQNKIFINTQKGITYIY